jgi:hypothetical protein
MANEENTYDSYYKPGTRWNESPDRLYKYMECKLCGGYDRVGENATAVTCQHCVADMVDPPETSQHKRQEDKKPAGWHWMAVYVHGDGTVYHKGTEQPDLKGTLDKTVIAPKVRLSKKEKDRYKYEAALKISKLKKKLATLRWKKDKKIVQAEIKYFSRIAVGKFPEGFKEKLFAE